MNSNGIFKFMEFVLSFLWLPFFVLLLMERTEVKKRAGDLGKIIASNNRLHKFISWKPKYKKLSLMVKSSIKWEKKLKSF